MEKKFEQIINEGKRTGKTTTEINAELKATGANFHLDFEGAVSGWSEKEMEEGFIPAKEESKNTGGTLNLSRDVKLANKTQIQELAGSKVAITYDKDGYVKTIAPVD
jgi:hypothetical protein